MGVTLDLTPHMREALAALDGCDPRYGGVGVLTSGATGLYDNQAWINHLTAKALERRGLVTITGEGEEAEVRRV